MSVIVRLFNLIAVIAATLLSHVLGAQNNPKLLQDRHDDIVMTWKKTTPDQEMKDDVKALAEHGVTVKYSGVKRNSNQEITAIKIEYKDRKGNKGALEYSNEQPIADIVLFQQNGEIGFGKPTQSNDIFAMNDVFGRSFGGDSLSPFGQGFQLDQMPDMKSYNFSFGNGQGGSGSSKMIIQESGKKPLVIEDGKVVEGGADYTQEELDEILKNNKMEFKGMGKLDPMEFDFRNEEGLEQFKERMKALKGELKTNSEEDDLEKAKADMLKAKEEMVKAREELEKAKKALEKEKAPAKAKAKKG
ncbi:MAG: hypothetical protein RLZZ500_2217 [Bacteroidota bacterium]|jgi:hypothetical protein